jgi:hypothetical protein
MVTSPQVTWPFFKARAKRPSHPIFVSCYEQGGVRTNCTPDRAEPSGPYFQAGGLCQID